MCASVSSNEVSFPACCSHLAVACLLCILYLPLSCSHLWKVASACPVESLDFGDLVCWFAFLFLCRGSDLIRLFWLFSSLDHNPAFSPYSYLRRKKLKKTFIFLTNFKVCFKLLFVMPFWKITPKIYLNVPNFCSVLHKSRFNILKFSIKTTQLLPQTLFRAGVLNLHHVDQMQPLEPRYLAHRALHELGNLAAGERLQ